jgi:hypothetical protein
MRSRIAHARALKDNAGLVWNQEEQENNPQPMTLEQLLRTAAVNEHRSIARSPLPSSS